MPIQKLHIENCTGIAGITDPNDLKNGIAYYAENLDVSNRFGAFVGLPEDKAVNAIDNSTWAGNHAVPFGDDGRVILLTFEADGRGAGIDNDNATVLQVNDNNTWTQLMAATDIGLSKDTSSATSGAQYRAISPESNAVHIGLGDSSNTPPAWVGQLNYTQKHFSDWSAGQWKVEAAELRSDTVGTFHGSTNFLGLVFPQVTSTPVNNLGNPYSTQKFNTIWEHKVDQSNVNIPLGKHTYYATFVYDSTQESLPTKILQLDLFRGNVYIYPGSALGGHVLFKDDSAGAGTAWTMNTTGTALQTRIGSYYMGSTSVDWWTTNADADIDSYRFLTGEDPATPDGDDTDTRYLFDRTPTSWNLGTSNKLKHFMAENSASWGLAAVHFKLRIRAITSASGNPTTNRRVTGIKIYRKSSVLRPDWAWYDTDPLLVKHYDMRSTTSETFTQITTPGGADALWDHASDDYWELEVQDETPTTSLLTYESESGLPWTGLPNMTMHYALSAVCGGYNVVGRCYNPDVAEGATVLYRSKPWRFDTFDWVEDYLKLNAVPVALKYYQGRLYAFCRNMTYVIDPYSFDIIETWQSIGGIHHNSVAVTEQGMFWGDQKNLYFHDGVRLHTIGDSVLYLDRALAGSSPYDVGWRARDTAHVPCAIYVSKLNSYLMTYKVGSSYYGLLWNLEYRNWMVVTYSASVDHVHGAINGLPMLGIGGNLYGAFESAASGSDGNRRKWRWVSHDMGEKGVRNRFYKVYVRMTELASDREAGYSSHNATPTDGTTLPTVTYMTDGLYESANEKATYLLDPQIDEGGAGVTMEVDLRQWTGGTPSPVAREYSHNFAIHLKDNATYDNVVAGLTVVHRPLSPR